MGFRFDRTSLIEEAALATYEQISGPDITKVANYTMASLGFTDITKEDNIFGGQANLQKQIGAVQHNYLQTGFRFRMQQPKTASNPMTYNYVGPRGAAFSRYVDQGYTY